MHWKAPLTSILLCLEKIAVSHGPFNGLDSLNEEPKDSGILTTTKQKIVDDWSIHFWFGEKYVTEIEKNFSNLPRAGL